MRHQVDPEEEPEFYSLCIPMDLETVRSQVDSGYYLSLDEFLHDIELIKTNAEEYNPRGIRGARGRDTIHNACLLVDTVQSHVYKLKEEVGHVFRRCERMAAERTAARSDGPLSKRRRAEAPTPPAADTAAPPAKACSPPSQDQSKGHEAIVAEVSVPRGREVDHALGFLRPRILMLPTSRFLNRLILY